MNTTRTSRPILPLATLGLLGGGQLGRMTALAARSAGYRVHALDPDPQCAIRPVVENCITARWDDAQAAAALAQSCDVVTLEIEKVSVASLVAAAQYAPVRPGPEVLDLVQNRLRQKNWLVRQGFPVGAYTSVRSSAELTSVAESLGHCFVKVAEGGYDGRGQTRLGSALDAVKAWEYLGGLESVAEQAIDLEYEISVLVARRPNGEIVVYPPALNHHENQILVWSVLPAPIPQERTTEAQTIARSIAAEIGLEGVLVVEMFMTRQGKLLVNELAPRPHNSYHASERACVTGQFEQLVRAICDLPLGSAEIVRPAAIVNLLGDLWTGAGPLNLTAALRIPEVRLHLYDKSVARPGRKMGHISATGLTPQQALEQAMTAKRSLHFQTEETGEETTSTNIPERITGGTHR